MGGEKEQIDSIQQQTKRKKTQKKIPKKLKINLFEMDQNLN